MMKAFFLITFVLSPGCFAGDNWYEKGNGGFALKCGDKYYTFDLVEAKERYRQNLDLEKQANLQERVAYLISKIEKNNPKRAALYRQWFNTFMEDSEFIPGAHFTPTPDEGFSYIGSYNGQPCSKDIEQVVFQREPSILNKRYTVSGDFWKQLDVINQAALVMHELIYREVSLPPSQHRISESARYFNGWLNSTNFATGNLQTYLATLQALHFVTAESFDLPILLSGRDDLRDTWASFPLSFSANGHVSTMTLQWTEQFSFQGFKMSSEEECLYTKGLRSLGVLVFDANGGIEQIGLLNSGYPVQQCAGIMRNQNYTITGNSWMFTDGQIRDIGLVNYKPSRTTLIAQVPPYQVMYMPSNWPATVQFHLDEKQNLQSFEILGLACYDDSKKSIRVWRETLDETRFAWNTGTLAQDIAKLKLCRNP